MFCMPIPALPTCLVQINSMHEAAEHKRESDSNRASLEEEVDSTAAMTESELNTERRKKLQEKQRVRRQIEAQMAEAFSNRRILRWEWHDSRFKTVAEASNPLRVPAGGFRSSLMEKSIIGDNYAPSY